MKDGVMLGKLQNPFLVRLYNSGIEKRLWGMKGFTIACLMR